MEDVRMSFEQTEDELKRRYTDALAAEHEAWARSEEVQAELRQRHEGDVGLRAAEALTAWIAARHATEAAGEALSPSAR